MGIAPEPPTHAEPRPPAPAEDALRDEVKRHRALLVERLAQGEDGMELGRRNARFLERVLAAAYQHARSVAGEPAQALALAAVGSFGRGAVALRSDADVRILLPRARMRDTAAQFSEALLYPLWDAGLSVGHQVVEPTDALALAQDDLTTATSILELRTLSGDESLAARLVERAATGIFAEGELGKFVDRLEAEAAGRHARFGGLVHLLEPDVKNGAGGLRDVDGARWAVQARFRVGPSPWHELVRLGVLVPREAKEIADAEEFLFRVRNRLHAHADRRSDRLTFEEQELIATEMGYAPPADRSSGTNEGVERFMQDYYLHARVIMRARERLLDRARPPKRRGKPIETDLGRGVHLFDGQVTVAGTQDLASDPALALRAYAACVQRGAPMLAFAREAIAREAADPAWTAALRASPEAAALFVELLCHVPEVRTRRAVPASEPPPPMIPARRGSDGPPRPEHPWSSREGSIAGELHDVGLLLAMVPEFQPVTGRVHHDVYHVYTVDVHSVAALDCLRALCRGDLAHEYPLACRLAAEIARPRPLFLATLLHDVGKGYPDATGSRKNHSKSGADLCDTILPRLGLAVDEVAEARELVLSHLAMYHTATRRDLDDPAAIHEFARAVRGREGLRDLYLLTVVDLTTTSPTAMTTWKARMLDELYFATDEFLADAAGEEHAHAHGRAPRTWEAAAELWPGPKESLQGFLQSMPERYVLANAPESICAHAGVALARGGRPVHAALVPSPHPEVAELCVVADDKPGLLERIAAAITAARFEVLAAQVYSRPVAGGIEAVDLFWIRDRVDGAEAVARGMERLELDLHDVCTGVVDPAELLRVRTGSSSRWRERPSPAVATEVMIDDRASPRHTVVEIFAKDRPGLLYTIARVLYQLGLSIALSKINTEGTKVADVFYVSELDGSKVKPGERYRVIREGLLGAIAAE